MNKNIYWDFQICISVPLIRDVLFLSFLSTPMAWFNFVVTWFICFYHSKWLSKRTPRYFTVLVGVKRFPSSLNLKFWSIFFELEWKMINSVLVKLRDSLLAFSHWDRFLKSKFICLATFLVNCLTVAYWCHQQNGKLLST